MEQAGPGEVGKLKKVAGRSVNGSRYVTLTPSRDSGQALAISHQGRGEPRPHHQPPVDSRLRGNDGIGEGTDGERACPVRRNLGG